MMRNPLKPEPATIIDEYEETPDTVTFTMRFDDLQQQASYRYQPGQFNMISIFGAGEAPISMSSDSTNRASFQHTIKRVGNITSLLESMKTGDKVGVRGPYGTFWPLESAGGFDILIVGGGIGFAPLRPVIEHILNNRTVYGEVTVMFGAKTPRDIIFTRDFDRWTAGHIQVLLTVDRVDGQPWGHYVGVVPTLFEKVRFNPRRTIAMVCGPEIMMRFSMMDLIKRGFLLNHVYMSMERRMSCGTAQCGHCFFGPKFVCRDGPVFPLPDVYDLLGKGV